VFVPDEYQPIFFHKAEKDYDEYIYLFENYIDAKSFANEKRQQNKN